MIRPAQDPPRRNAGSAPAGARGRRGVRLGVLLAGALLGLPGCDRQSGPAPESPAGGQAGTPPAVVCDPDNGGLSLPEGFCALVVADHFGTLRHLAVDAEGDIYAALLNRRLGLGGVLGLRDNDGDGRVDESVQFGERGGVGLALDDQALYLGTDAAIVRYRLRPGELVPGGEPEVVVQGFPASAVHASKPVALDGQGGLMVMVGAPSNACQVEDRGAGSPGQDPCPLLEYSGGVWRVPAGATAQDYLADGERVAGGIRHALALAYAPEAGLYLAQQGRDALHGLWPGRYSAADQARLPSEELLQVEPGAVFAWPYCFHDPDRGRDGTGALVPAPEYLTTPGAAAAAEARCAAFPAPVRVFPAHASPGDMVFYPGGAFPARYDGGLFVALQGSYSASEGAVGHEVLFQPFAGGRPVGPPERFASGFVRAPAAGEPGEPVAFRPGGLAVGPDGSLYISDSTQGRIWRVLYRPEQRTP